MKFPKNCFRDQQTFEYTIRSILHNPIRLYILHFLL